MECLPSLPAVSFPRKLKVKDRKVVALFWCMTTCVCFKMVFVDFYLMEGCFQKYDVHGTAHFAVSSDLRLLGTEREFPPKSWRPLRELSYCCQDSRCSAAGLLGTRLPCIRMLGSEFDLIGTQTSNILIPTMGREWRKSPNMTCFNNSYTVSCDDLWTYDKQQTYFLAEVEEFNLFVEHSAVDKHGRDRELKISNKMTQGVLRVTEKSRVQDEVCRNHSASNAAPCEINVPRHMQSGMDYLHVRTWLAAAGVELDVPWNGSSHDLPRETGLILTLSVEYSNQPSAHYIYDVKALGQSFLQRTSASFSGQSFFQRETGTSTEARKRQIHVYGIYVEAVVYGYFAYFEIGPIMLQCGALVAFIGIIRYVVGALMKRSAFFRREYYTALLQRRSPDFGSQCIQELEGMSDQELDEMCKCRHLGTGGSVQQKIIRLVEDGWEPAVTTEFVSFHI